MEALRQGKVKYDFVEMMACPGGCSGGGGQPIYDGKELSGLRAHELLHTDESSWDLVPPERDKRDVEEYYSIKVL